MAAEEEIARAIGELHESRSGRDCQNLFLIIDSIIQETREDNDTAGRIRALRNQGKISGLKEVLALIISGNPAVPQKMS